MELYEEKEHIISSDEYSDEDDDDDDLMNVAVSAQDHKRSSAFTNISKRSNCTIDQKQKELSSLIRRNKISVIYKNKSIKWLNNKKKRERYKESIYLNVNKNNVGQIMSTTVAPIEQEKQNLKSNGQKSDIIDIQDIDSNQNGDDDLIFTNSYKQDIIEDEIKKIEPKDDKEIADEKITLQEENNIDHIEKLEAPIAKENELLGKRPRSTSPSVLNESIDKSINHNEKKFRTVSPQFYKSINDVFPKFDKLATNHIDTIVNDSLAAVEDKMKSLSNELNTLNEILQAKEVEWNRLLHLKMVKEEIYARLNKKWNILQLKESFSKKQGQNILLELKELEFYLSEKKSSIETNQSSITIQKLIENRANMNADDLKREKNNTSRLHSLLVSQNMLHAAESLENISAINNSEKTSMVLTSKNCDIYNHLDGGKLAASNKGRQGEVRDVKSLIAEFRQKKPELLPRVGKRIKSTESNVQRQSYSIPLFEKTARAQYFTKDHQSESYLLPNSVNEISITPIGSRSKKLSSPHDIDFVNAMNNHYNVRLEDKFIKSQVKGDFVDGKCSKNIQYPLCQECKNKESRFVCAGCGNQWYCSKKCQVSAWDKHSDLCTE